jgi:hypothetical protein
MERNRLQALTVPPLATKFPALCGTRGPGNSAGIATDYGAGRSGIESRWGRYFPPFQTGPGSHPALVKWVPCLYGVKVRPGRAADHSPPSSTVVMED